MRLYNAIISTCLIVVAAALHNTFTAEEAKRGIASCSNLVQGLLQEDCEYMSRIGVDGMGFNDWNNNGKIWIGGDGPNIFTFANQADVPVILLIWLDVDFDSSFVRTRKPYVTYSLPNPGDTVVVSIDDGISGAFAALYDRTTPLTPYGQVYNTWGEFTSGPYATINVSREPNMGGNSMEIVTGGGCVSNMDTCVFKCYGNDVCWQDNTYYLKDCEAGSQPGNPHIGYDAKGQPQGGCGGWENGGVVQIDFLN
ncbi:hypothetical protein NLG97_g3174 [Lecanicillium saksenae]|uniref:Uncharacterized protein n=1 Tax=Lecanicillium saksenae TaxID=468837 RepID=A0ACC1QYT1_9HYPO|nr:hypothetical protein NLG97_g3174 [Lecanicillium saksenae]